MVEIKMLIGGLINVLAAKIGTEPAAVRLLLSVLLGKEKNPFYPQSS